MPFRHVKECVINLKQLRHVMVLSRTGNYAKAAAELHIPQPVLSRSIKDIEAQYGTRLFDRGRFGAALTPAGYAIIKEIEEIVQRVDGLHQSLTNLPHARTERIRLAAAPLPAAILLPRLLAATIALRPDLAIEADIQPLGRLLESLREGDVDFALCLEHTIPSAANLRIERIATTRTGYIVRKGHPLLANRHVTPGDVARYPSIASWSAPPRTRPLVSCNNYQVQMDVTRQSDAIWMGSLDVVRDDDTLEELKVRDISTETRAICVIMPINRKQTESYFVMMKLLREMTQSG